MRLRDHLKFEFFFPERDAYRERIGAELERLDPDWETADGREVLCGAPLLVRPPGAAVVRRRAAGGGRAPRRARPPQARGRGRLPDRVRRGRASRCCCRAGCTGRSRCRGSCSPPRCSWPRNLDLVDPGREELARRRQEWAAQVRDVVAPRRRHRRARRRGAAGERGSGTVSVDDVPGTRAGTWTEEQLLADVEAAPAGPAGRRVLRLRRHGDRRLLAGRLRPAPPAVAARARRPTWGSCCSPACAG